MSPLYFKILLVSLPIVLFLQVISPLYSGGGQLFVPQTNIKNSNELLKQYDGALKQADQLIKDANALRADYESFDEATKATLNTILPSGVDPVLLLDELTDLIASTGLETDGISQRLTGGSALYPGLNVYDLSFSVGGTFDDFKRILKTLQSSLRFYDIQSVSFNAPEKEGDLTKLQVSFRTYYLK